MAKSDELALKVRYKYCLLSFVNPDNELLKYYVLRLYNRRSGFYPNQDSKVKQEFFKRFGRGLVELIMDLDKDKIKVSSSRYKEVINCFLLQNYYNALEKELAPPELRN